MGVCFCGLLLLELFHAEDDAEDVQLRAVGITRLVGAPFRFVVGLVIEPLVFPDILHRVGLGSGGTALTVAEDDVGPHRVEVGVVTALGANVSPTIDLILAPSLQVPLGFVGGVATPLGVGLGVAYAITFEGQPIAELPASGRGIPPTFLDVGLEILHVDGPLPRDGLDREGLGAPRGEGGDDEEDEDADTDDEADNFPVKFHFGALLCGYAADDGGESTLFNFGVP